MFVATERISRNQDFTVKAEISEPSVEAYFEELEPCRALSPVRYEARLRRKRQGIAMQAEIRAALEQSCSRCAKPLEREFLLTTELVLLSEAEQPEQEEVILSAEELDVVFYQGNQIDLDRVILESIYMELDSQVLCNEACQGLCLQCGQNLNEGPCGCKC